MIKTIEGTLSGEGLHLGIAAAQWNQTVTDGLIEGALRRCQELGVTDVTLLRVPGALELPLACHKLVDSGCNAIVAIGTVVKGETDHYELVSSVSAHGVAQVGLETGVPVANAILAVHNFDQAVERARPDDSNRGREAVDAAVSTATALLQVGSD